MLPSTAAYAAVEAATNRVVTNYRLTPPSWRKGQRLTITAIADLHAGGPNMGIARVRAEVDAAQALKSDLIVLLGDFFATHHFVTEVMPPAAWAGGPGRFRGADDLPGTLAPVSTDDPVILLAHEPDIFPQVPDRVALTLAGHTHGGQICLPLMPPVWAPSEFGARFAYGHIVEHDRHLIVSGGLGCSKVPLRLGVPPEILHIELVSA